MEASGVAQFAGGPEDRRLRLVLLGPLSDQRLFCGWELASRATAAFLLANCLGYLAIAVTAVASISWLNWGLKSGSLNN